MKEIKDGTIKEIIEYLQTLPPEMKPFIASPDGSLLGPTPWIQFETEKEEEGKETILIITGEW